MIDPKEDPLELWAFVASAARLDGTACVGDQWVVTGFIPYESIVMLAMFDSANEAAIALRKAALCGSETTRR